MVRREDLRTIENLRRQKVYGRWIIGLCSLLFFPGLVFLAGISFNSRATNEVIQVLSKGKIRTFGRDEVIWARIACGFIFLLVTFFIVFAILYEKNW
jgi:hypothetical protein